jgi:hypothetical protein
MSNKLRSELNSFQRDYGKMAETYRLKFILDVMQGCNTKPLIISSSCCAHNFHKRSFGVMAVYSLRLESLTTDQAVCCSSKFFDFCYGISAGKSIILRLFVPFL